MDPEENIEDINNYLREILLDTHEEVNANLPSSRRPKNLKEFIERPGAFDPIKIPVDKSVVELLLMILMFSITNCLSVTSMTNLFKLINSIFAEPILEDSRYSIDQLLNPQSNVQFYAVCHNCSVYLGKFGEIDTSVKSCQVCGVLLDLSNPSNTSYFVIIDPSVQISDILKSNEVYYDYVVRERQSQHNNLSDIYDGKLYKKFVTSLSEEAKGNYASAILNTDGAPKFKWFNMLLLLSSIWPIYLILNELPPQLRMNQLITCGLWFHKKKPEMVAFLDPLVEVLNKLSDEGVTCSIKGEVRQIKLYTLACCVDSVARAPIQGIKQYNGNFGCNWCLHPGQYSYGSMKYPLLENASESRKKESMIADMFKATPENPINGIKYPSPLINLEFFDIVSGFVPDYLHCCLAGVASFMTECYLDILHLNENEIQRIDTAMLGIKVPHLISRLTRPLSVRNDWKSREWENFVLYYSVPIFLQINMSKKLLKHWLLFVESLHILLRSTIQINELDYADALLLEFVVKTETYFGVKAMNFNVHQLTHLAESVLNWGPLWAHSTYPFESGNYNLLKAIKCARGVTHQIIRFTNINHSINVLKNYTYPKICNTIKLFCNDILTRKLKTINKISEITYLGKGNPFLNDNIIDALNLSTSTRLYYRMVKDECLFSVSVRLKVVVYQDIEV